MSLGCRIQHFFVARHYRGHGVHSPFLYDFIRKILMKSCSKEDLLTKIHQNYNLLPITSRDFDECNSGIVFIPNEFLHLGSFQLWRSGRVCLSLWTKYGVLIFFDPKLPNQHYNLRS